MIDFGYRPLTALTASIELRSAERPADVATAALGEMQSISCDAVLTRNWAGLRYCWDAPALSHKPLYFEEVNLERYGYGPRYLRVLQPVLSGAHFFGTVPTLPYQMVASPPWRHEYVLGHYRPGSPVPYRLHYPPFTLRGGLAEAGVALGLVFLIP